MTAAGGAGATDPLVALVFSEIAMTDQLLRNRLARALPRGMELSQFLVLNHLAQIGHERSPAQLAHVLHVTRGAMTNTLSRLEGAGHIHVRPDWDDGRRKFVGISPAGRTARDAALDAITPVLEAAVAGVGPERLRQILPVLRELRQRLDREETPQRKA